jgi:hypothetical protein
VGNNDPHDFLTKIDSGRENEPASSDRFDHYRSLADSNLMILVAKNVVPPFRFKAGGWELFQSSIELGPSIKSRVAENGFLMFRVDEDQTGWIDLSSLPATDAKREDK